MSLLSKLLYPVKWLLKKNSEEVRVSEPITSQDAAVAATPVDQELPAEAVVATPAVETVSKDDEISAFAAKLKKILIAAGHDIDIIFDDAVSIAKKI